MIDIKAHATERFVERVMGLGETDIRSMTDIQIKSVNEKILDTLYPYLNQMAVLKNGNYHVGGFIYIVDNDNLLTIKHDRGNNQSSYKEVSGGRMRSGAKVKKKYTKISPQERQHDRKNYQQH
jgi:hypothetical protein